MAAKLVLFALFGLIAGTWADKVQIPYERVKSRPANNPYCQAMFAFCPNGTEAPVLDDDDVVEVWAMKAPIWEFKFGDLMGKLKGFHDAVGMKSLKTGKNYTLEWYELDQLLNCTFPHEVQSKSGDEELLWCNQGAGCFYDGIDDKHWSQNGTLNLISHINGSMFNNAMKWMKEDNNTGVYYESWAVLDQWDDVAENRDFIMKSYDCKDFVLRLYDQLYLEGAVFNNSAGFDHKYSFIILHAHSAELVDYNEHKADILKFYRDFQPHQGCGHYNARRIPADVFGRKMVTLEHLMHFFLDDLVFHDKFYIHYNQKYYLLKMHWPFVSLKYGSVPLPGYASNGDPLPRTVLLE